jgi:hypothetical protein
VFESYNVPFTIGIISAFLLLIVQRQLFNPLYFAFLIYHSLRRLDTQELKIFSEKIIEFCEIHIGKTKNRPEVVLSQFDKVVFYKGIHGLYQKENKSILINCRLVKNNFNLISTVIHEYIHHTQFEAFKKEEYNRILAGEEVQYINHPWEESARWFSRKYSRKCLIYVLNELKYF